MLISLYVYVDIVFIDFLEVWKIFGVIVILGDEFFLFVGEEIKDRLLIVYKKVRYYGELVVVVVVENLIIVKKVVYVIKVFYQFFFVVNFFREVF